MTCRDFQSTLSSSCRWAIFVLAFFAFFPESLIFSPWFFSELSTRNDQYFINNKICVCSMCRRKIQKNFFVKEQSVIFYDSTDTQLFFITKKVRVVGHETDFHFVRKQSSTRKVSMKFRYCVWKGKKCEEKNITVLFNKTESERCNRYSTDKRFSKDI